MSKESEILRKALAECGDDYENEQGKDAGSGTFLLLATQPVTIICDRMAQKLHELGYRVTQTLNVEKRSKK